MSYGGLTLILLQLAALATTICVLLITKETNQRMATQEQRLQAIFGQLTEVKAGINTLSQQVADLKANNPQLEDEITAIEGTVTEIRDSLPGVEREGGSGTEGGGEPA